MRGLAVALASLLAALAACGAPAELGPGDAAQLRLSHDRVVAALADRDRLAAGRAARARLLARVRRIVAGGALEPRQLDEFGLAALGELRLAVPSLVLVDGREIPRGLDRDALRRFLEHAVTDPDAATRRPAAVEVDRIAALLDDADAGPDTELPGPAPTVADYLDGLESRLAPTWPDLADDLAAIRRDLG